MIKRERSANVKDGEHEIKGEINNNTSKQSNIFNAGHSTTNASQDDHSSHGSKGGIMWNDNSSVSLSTISYPRMPLTKSSQSKSDSKAEQATNTAASSTPLSLFRQRFRQSLSNVLSVDKPTLKKDDSRRARNGRSRSASELSTNPRDPWSPSLEIKQQKRNSFSGSQVNSSVSDKRKDQERAVAPIADRRQCRQAESSVTPIDRKSSSKLNRQRSRRARILEAAIEDLLSKEGELQAGKLHSISMVSRTLQDPR